ncbi:hypothetical protein BT96DRAFT_925472 [Gymnopus androsaceus JB14]|uniref:Uncharacterized protein n=1 Tax=Gymnopus androsaceus JB14 TaxID=1447944 RepID=A0A6A4H1L1_9AGAR|nr:hypothetical protein BT96DRAFT_925472 [Gymnopus androsaceus JB14]
MPKHCKIRASSQHRASSQPRASSQSRASSQPRTSSTHKARPRPITPRDKFEAACLKIHATWRLPDSFFPTDAEIDAELAAIDAENAGEDINPETFQHSSSEERRARYHQSWDRIFDAAGQDTMEVWGMKPRSGDPIQLVSVPGSPLSIRVWDSGLKLNSPATWTLRPANQTGVFDYVILSREEMFGFEKKDIPAGEERFDIKRVVTYALRRPQQDDLIFELPAKPITGAVQPRDGFA